MAINDQQSVVDRLPIKEGAIFGAASFVTGYLVTLLVVAIAETDDFTDDLLEASGWLYYNAQLADVEISVTGDDAGFGGIFDGMTFNYVTDDEIFGEPFSLEAPSIIYHLIPIIALVLFGFALARYVDARTTQDAALAGSTLAIGAVPLTIVGTVVFTMEEDGIELAPIFMESLVLVGILFPVIFGAIGGILSTRV